MDDDNGSREAISELLSSMGYDVRQAANADSAMQELSTAKIDVLLTDIVLPVRSGIDLAKAATERDPNIRIVFASGGYSPTSEEAGFDCSSLCKRFTIEQLHALIEAMHGSARKRGRN
ncbi:response regulator [Caballeronia cordobensis]|uniref:response regulator n=1 Tax=Caballeronia cordobensis TaxID=1353886 RepID=UPI001364C665|nr:response regulator [Caballeronia cordobensis]